MKAPPSKHFLTSSTKSNTAMNVSWTGATSAA